LEVAYEYAALVLNGDCSVEGQPLQERVLYYLVPTARRYVSPAGRVADSLLVGGPPFPEKILMWWNFVARTPQEIVDARSDWEERRRFGEVTGYPGQRLAAPSLVKFATRIPPVEADGFASGVNARVACPLDDSLFGIVGAILFVRQIRDTVMLILLRPTARSSSSTLNEAPVRPAHGSVGPPRA